jgi:hypothetical protein
MNIITVRLAHFAIILVSVYFLSSELQNQVAAQSVDEVQRLSKWAQESTAKYNSGIKILGKITDTELIIDDLYNGSMAERVADRLVTSNIRTIETDIEEFNASLLDFPKLGINLLQFRTFEEEYRALILSTPAFLEQSLRSVKEMYVAVLEGDDTKYAELSALSYSRFVFMLQGENNYIRSSVITMPGSHPNKSLMQSIISTNNALIALNTAFVNQFAAEDNNLTLASTKMLEQISLASNFLNLAERENSSFWKSSYESEGLTKGLKNVLRDFEASFFKSIQIERSLVEGLRTVADLIVQTSNANLSLTENDELLRGVDSASILVQSLVDDRLEEQNRRFVFAQELVQ